MSGDETSFIQWRERSKQEVKRAGGSNTAMIVGIVAAALVLIAVVAFLLLH